MKQEYKNYKSGELQEVESNMKPLHKKELNKYIIFLNGNAAAAKVNGYKRILLGIYDTNNKSFNFDLDKLREFNSVLNRSKKKISTKNDIIKCLKRFLVEKYDDHEKRFKKFKDFKTNGKDQNQEKINANTLLKDSEVEKLVKKLETLRYKALFMLSLETAGRPSEVLNLKWNDINLNEKNPKKIRVKLTSTKNKTTRLNPIKESVIHLKRYKQEYPYNDVKESDYIFPDLNERSKPFKESMWKDHFTRLSLKILKRHVWPYLVRHTTLSIMIRKLSPNAYEEFSDHSIGTGLKFYGHISSDQVSEEVWDKIHVEELTEEEKIELKEIKERLDNFEGLIEMFLSQPLKKGATLEMKDEDGNVLTPKEVAKRMFKNNAKAKEKHLLAKS